MSRKSFSIKSGLKISFLGHALECRTCLKSDPNCLIADDVGVRHCDNDNDLCYAWFDRTGMFKSYF